MQKLLTTLLFATIQLTLICASAQGSPEKGNRPSRKQFAQTQAETIAANLQLDEATARRFVDTYLRCQQEIWKCRPTGGAHKHRKCDPSDISEQEAQKIIRERFAHRAKMNEIQERYYGEYSQFLTQRQILSVYNQEQKMMDRMMRRHGQKDKPNKRATRSPE